MSIGDKLHATASGDRHRHDTEYPHPGSSGL